MRVLKNIFSQLHSFVLWALASALLWGWVFSFVTDTSIEKKVTVYCYVPEIRDTELSAKLEEDMPEGLKMIRVRSFEYVMMDMEAMRKGDLFLIPASTVEQYKELLNEDLGSVKAYDAATGEGIAGEYITYLDEDYYLFYGAGSTHIEDGKAKMVAELLIKT